MAMKILITGATGFLGSHVAEQCMLAGFSVTCLVRSGSQTDFLESIKADIKAVNFNDEAALEQQLVSADVLVNCIADTRSHASYDERAKVEIDLTTRLFNIAQRVQVRRFIQLSTVMAYGFNRPAKAINEAYPKSPDFIYNRMARDREEALKALYQPNKTDLFILQPANALGKRDTDFLPNFLSASIFRVFPVVGDGRWEFSCIDARDVGRAMVHLVNLEIAGSETFLVKGFDTNWFRLKQALDQYLQRKTITFPLPKPLMFGLGYLFEKLFPYGVNIPLTRFSVSVISTTTLFDDKKIKGTGFNPRWGLSEALNEYID